MPRVLHIEVTLDPKRAVQGGKVMERSVSQSVKRTAAAAKQAKGSFQDLAGAFTSLIVAQKAAQVIGGAVKPAIDLEMARPNPEPPSTFRCRDRSPR